MFVTHITLTKKPTEKSERQGRLSGECPSGNGLR
jgi:hypothetical protein